MSEWPSLPLDDWDETRQTLLRWTQIVGKIQLALTPLINHWWNVPLHVTARGLITSEMPYDDRSLDIEFDFVAHLLRIRTSDDEIREVVLGERSVADFYRETFSILKALRIDVKIWPVPVEIPDDVTPLDRDRTHHHYDRRSVETFWKIVTLVHHVFTTFRARFIGKSSPVHFFWGSFDLAVTRFSGRLAPERPGADRITREAYSHEVSSIGFWAGDSRLRKPTFYSYAAPEPAGFRTAAVSPSATYYDENLGGFYLDYDIVRAADDPQRVLLEYCQSTYDAAAEAGRWDRELLERRHPGR